MDLSHQLLIDFLGPHGPSSFETQGLFISTIFADEHEFINKINVMIRIFFICKMQILIISVNYIYLI